MSTAKRELSEQQEKFLDALVDTKGNIKEAMNIAGYGATISTSYMIRTLKDEILEVAKRLVAAHAVRGAFEAIDVLDRPAQPGAANKLKAAEALMQRAGVQKDSDLDKISETKHIVILPAKKYKISEEE